VRGQEPELLIALGGHGNVIDVVEACSTTEGLFLPNSFDEPFSTIAVVTRTHSSETAEMDGIWNPELRLGNFIIAPSLRGYRRSTLDGAGSQTLNLKAKISDRYH
jgi:hypothetical protein